jgi:ABC-2 type transport system permease protein
VLRDPMPLDGLASSSLRALVYVVLGIGVTAVRMRRRDA